METELPVRGNEPMQSSVTPGSSGGIPNIRANLGEDVFSNLVEELSEEQIQNLVSQHGSDLVKWLGKNLKGVESSFQIFWRLVQPLFDANL